MAITNKVTSYHVSDTHGIGLLRLALVFSSNCFCCKPVSDAVRSNPSLFMHKRDLVFHAALCSHAHAHVQQSKALATSARLPDDTPGVGTQP
jgi:hypothetical protein